MQYTSVTPDEFAAVEGLDDWRYVLGAIHTSFRAGSFPAAAALVTAIAEVAETAVHHPDVDVRYPDRVSVTLTTHATGGLTTLDLDVARQISALAAEAGAPAEPHAQERIEIGIDTMDADRIRPFWAAVMGYSTAADGSLFDPLRRGPALWFQQMDVMRPDRNRLHLDVSVPHDLAESRLRAALAAGGTLLTDQYARAFWVLADAEGNEVCICTWQDR